MKKKEKMEKRKASLAEAGLEEGEVDETLASFDALDDDAFESIVAMMKKKVGMKKYAGKHDKKEEKPEAMDHGDKEEEKKKKEKEAKAEEEAEAEVTPELLEDVETSEATMVEPEAIDELDQARASVADWFSNHVLKNK